jgi:hypothetical protein
MFLLWAAGLRLPTGAGLWAALPARAGCAALQKPKSSPKMALLQFAVFFSFFLS